MKEENNDSKYNFPWHIIVGAVVGILLGNLLGYILLH